VSIVLGDTEKGSLVFAADSAGATGDEIYTIDTPKVFALGSYLLGYCGSYRVGQVLRHHLELPEPPAGDPERFLVREVVPILRETVAAQCGVADASAASGPIRRHLGEKTALLVGFRGRIWCVGPDLTVTPEPAYAAIGSGRLRAYGALHALHAAGVGPVGRRLELALEATFAFTANVRPPWRFVRLDPDGGVETWNVASQVPPRSAAAPAEGR